MFTIIESLIAKDKPFIIIKYCNKWMNEIYNVYELVTIVSNRLRYLPIERKDATMAIRQFELPLLYKMDSNNMIWGDERFKEKYKKNTK